MRYEWKEMRGFWRLYDLEKDPHMCSIGIYELILGNGSVELWSVGNGRIKTFGVPSSKSFNNDSVRLLINYLIERSEKIIGITRKPFEGDIEFDVFV